MPQIHKYLSEFNLVGKRLTFRPTHEKYKINYYITSYGKGRGLVRLFVNDGTSFPYSFSIVNLKRMVRQEGNWVIDCWGIED